MDHAKSYQHHGSDWISLDSSAKALTESISWHPEYLQYENAKFSKSNNVGVFGQNARETGVPSEVWRYYLISTRPETNDAQFTWTDFIAKANSELLNNLGNYVNRIVKFCNARFNSVVPDPLSWPVTGPAAPPEVNNSGRDIPERDQFDESDQEFVRDVNILLGQYIESAESLKLRSALAVVMAISARGNQYLQDNKIDYSLLLSSPRRCAQIVLVSLNLVYLLSVLVHPFMPTTSDLILKQLNAPKRSLPRTFGLDLLPGHTIGEAVYLFRKIDADRAAFWRKQYGGNKPAANGNPSASSGSPAETKKSQKKSKTKTAAPPAYAGPKTDEMVDLERKIVAQGEQVRQIKAGQITGDSGAEVAKLLDLKNKLNGIVESLASKYISVFLSSLPWSQGAWSCTC